MTDLNKFVSAGQDVALTPPPADASKAELFLRNAFMHALASYPEIDQNTVFTALNATSLIIRQLAEVLNKTMEVSFRFLTDFYYSQKLLLSLPLLF